MVLKVNAGLFFRAEGGAAAAFGSKQSEGLPNITGTIGSMRTGGTGAFATQSGNGELQGRSNDVPSYISNFYASRSSAIYGASSHVTPVNSTIRVWKRTA